MRKLSRYLILQYYRFFQLVNLLQGKPNNRNLWITKIICRLMTGHFVHNDKTPWTDQQQPELPFLENMKIVISGENPSRVMKAIPGMDWMKLQRC